MRWYSTVDKDQLMSIPRRDQEMDLNPRIIIPIPNAPLEISPEGQFFIAPFVINNGNSRLIIPIPNEDALALLLKQVVCHFDRCIAFYHGDDPVSITVSQLKDSSKEKFSQLLADGELHPLVTDLYGSTREASDQSDFSHQPIVFRINTDYLSNWPRSIESLTRLIRQTYLASDGDLTVVPNGWTFGEHLQDSQYLGALATFCDNIYLYVNPLSQKVVGITAANHHAH